MDETAPINFLFIAVGMFSVIASITNWDYFFNHRKARLFLKLFGRGGARIFYALFGLAFVVLGILDLSGTAEIW